jgi:hypothetical protein
MTVVRPPVRRRRTRDKLFASLVKVFSPREVFKSFNFRDLFRSLESTNSVPKNRRVHKTVARPKKRLKL